jgi:hypothetical protein
MLRAFLISIGLMASAPACAEPLYDFVTSCKAQKLAACYARIDESLDQLEADEQGRAFCLPRSWNGVIAESTSYPVALLDNILLRLSAARFGRAEQPAELVMIDIVSDLYPCE